MSKYTTQVRYICEMESGFDFSDPLVNYNIDDIINAAREKIFIYPYPFFNEELRPEFERDILFHFYTDEIGQETVGLFKQRLGAKLRDIMPFYNDLFRAYSQDFDIFADVDYTTTHEGGEIGQKNVEGSTRSEGSFSGSGSRQGESTESATATKNEIAGKSSSNNSTRNLSERTTSESESEGSSTSEGRTSGTSHSEGVASKSINNTYNESNIHRDAYSDTPQTSILGVEGDGAGDPAHNVSDNYYLTNYRKITDNKSGGNEGAENGSNTSDGSTSGTSHEVGSTSNHSEAIGTHSADEVIDNVGEENAQKNESSTSTANGTTSEITGEQHTTTDIGSTIGAESYSSNDSFTNRIRGKQGSSSYSSMLMEYIQSRVNVMEMIYEQLEPLFMGIY